MESFPETGSILGHVVSEERYRSNRDHISVVKKYYLEAPPSNIGEVQCLLGLVRYFRRHVDNLGKITKPLYDLLKKPDMKSLGIQFLRK